MATSGGGSGGGSSGPQGHGHGKVVGGTDVTQFFNLLESNNPQTVQEVKELIVDNLNGTKESWFVGGLYEYYVQSGSPRCCDILCNISREPQDKYLIEKITEGIRSPVKDLRRQALTLLGHAVCKQPSWLYKITQLSLFKELIKLLKSETDVVISMTGLLSIIMMLPIIPMYIVPQVNDLFDVFGRLATWTNTTHNIPKDHVLHLQVGLYSLFHRLYAMFPCNFLSYLRHNFGTPDKRTVFLHTIMPMLEKVKMHPNLVTATRDAELSTSRWQSREYHDIIAECSKISLDAYESSLSEEIPSGFTANLGSNSNESNVNGNGNGTRGTITSYGAMEMILEDVAKVPATGLLSQAMGVSDLNSLVQFIEDFPNTAPPTPHSVTSGGAGNVAYSQGGLTVKTNLPAETAMEATPENTPIKDKDRSHFKLPPPNTPAAIQLFGPGPIGREEFVVKHFDRLNDRPAPQTPPATPYSSVPSSPLPLTSSMTRRDSIFDSVYNFRREPLMLQRLQKVQLEQQAAQAQLQQQQQLQQLEAVSGVASVASATASHPPQPASQPMEVVRKVAVVAPHTADGPGPVANLDFSSTENDKTAAVGSSTTGGGPLTPVAGQSLSSSGPGLINPDLSLITLDEEQTGLDQCSTTTTCATGGLHMADTESMLAFAKKVNRRLRYHSHCIAGSDYQSSLGPSPGTSPSSTSSSGVLAARSRYMKRSMSCPDIKKPVIDDKEGSAKQPSKLPEVSETEGGNGSEDANEIGANEGDDDQEMEEAPKEPEHPYEHLFQKILPGVLPLESRTLPSPHRLLDVCLVKAATVNQQHPRSRSEEVAMLKGQIELLHGQLLFERHRREAHALRNRRLAGKCWKTVSLEEQKETMKLKVHNLEKEIASLKKEVTIQRNMGLATETNLRNTVDGLQSKLEGYKKDLSELRKEKSQLESKFNRLSDDFSKLHKESDQKKADYFGLENEVRNCQKYIERNKELKTAYESRLKEILLLGELLRKYKEVVTTPSEYRYLLEQLEDCRLTSEEEVRGLRSSLESAKSQQEAANGTISDLMKRLEKREAIIELQRKDAQEKEQENQLRITALENKYESIKSTNQRLELEILSLQHQLSIKTVSARPTRGRIASASSPSNGEISPAGNSNHSDVDSAASAGGFQMSPDRKDLFIFGSPQFDHPSDGMQDLQAVLDREPSGIGAAAAAMLPSSGNSRRRNSSPLTTHTRDIGFRP